MADSPTVIDDFLHEVDFNRMLDLLHENIYRPVPFTVADGQGESLYNVNFQAILFDQKDNEFLQSELFYLLYPLLNKLEAKKLWVARLNCTTATRFRMEGKFHRDMANRENLTTACFYLNDNNGGTQFSNGSFVQSKANRVVIFPEPTLHAGVWCTDTKLRYVLNLNYEK